MNNTTASQESAANNSQVMVSTTVPADLSAALAARLGRAAASVVVSVIPDEPSEQPGQALLQQVTNLAAWFVTGLGWGLALHRRQTGQDSIFGTITAIVAPQVYLAVTSGFIVVERMVASLN